MILLNSILQHARSHVYVGTSSIKLICGSVMLSHNYVNLSPVIFSSFLKVCLLRRVEFKQLDKLRDVLLNVPYVGLTATATGK